ncbi:unnamed protein product, partial [Rotaria magnacalcarata]
MISDDICLGNIIVDGDSGNIVLAGFPYDEGVRRNNGRVGPKHGPDSFCQLWQRTGTVVNAEYDDLEEKAHQQFEICIQQLISNEEIPFVIGGGNDQSPK